MIQTRSNNDQVWLIKRPPLVVFLIFLLIFTTSPSSLPLKMAPLSFSNAQFHLILLWLINNLYYLDGVTFLLSFQK